MKKLLIVCCLLALALSVHARAIQEESDLSADKNRTSYAFGMIIGSEFLSAGMDVNYNIFTEGLKAAMGNGETKYSMDEAIEIVENAFRRAAAQKAEENRFKAMLFLTENGERPEVVSTGSGLQYEVLTEGSGARPALNDVVQVYYEGMLTDGSVFDPWNEPGNPAEFPLNGVISGWTEGLQLMNVGSRYRFYIPPELAYGERGAGQIIPPNSVLIFTVELLDIVKQNNTDGD